MSNIIDSLKFKLQDIKAKKINQSEEIKEFFKSAGKFITTAFSPCVCDENTRFPLVIGSLPLEPNEEIKEQLISRKVLLFDQQVDFQMIFYRICLMGKNSKANSYIVVQEMDLVLLNFMNYVTIKDQL